MNLGVGMSVWHQTKAKLKIAIRESILWLADRCVSSRLKPLISDYNGLCGIS